MSSLSLTESAKLSQDVLVQGVIQEYITIDNFSAVMPFVPAQGKALVYNRENADPATTVGFLDVGSTPVASQTTVTQITTSLGRLGGDAEVDNFEQVTLSRINDQMAVSIMNKARGIARKFSEYTILGSGTFPQFTGVNNLVSSTQLVDAGSTTAGAALSFNLLDQLIDKIDADGDQFFLLAEKKARRKLKALYRALGGATSDRVEIAWLNPITGEREVKSIMAYEGIPIFQNNFIVSETTYGATGKYRVTAGVFGEKVGLTGIMPFDNDPGVRVYDVGQKDSVGAEAKRLEMYVGMALYSTKALAQLVNMTQGTI